jgi:Macrocin-O-methyltransferase (TylF)
MPTGVIEHAGFKMTVRAGFFSESLPTHPRRQIALLNVDCDLYQSYKDCLDNLSPLVSPSGVIVFDDFLFQEGTEENFPGARKAVKEFLGSAYAGLLCSRRGNAYYVKPAARAASDLPPLDCARRTFGE